MQKNNREAGSLKHFKKLFLAAAFAVLLSSVFGYAPAVQAKKQKIKILFIGNSLTNPRNNPMIKYVKKLGSAGGFKVKAKHVVFRNEKMYNYANPRTYQGRAARKAIKAEKWDVVILQDQTDEATVCGPRMKKSMLTVARLVRKNSKKTKILLNCTWPYYKYRHGISIARQFRLMTANYKAARKALRKEVYGGKKDMVDVIWSGKAFVDYMTSKGHLNLYKRDRNHPSHAGAYMNACCTYAKVFGKTPVGNTYHADVDKKKAKKIQKTAAKYNLK